MMYGLRAAAANHAHVSHSKVPVLSGALVHPVLLGFALGIFFHPVHRRVADSAGDRHGMSNVRSQVDSVAAKLPGAAILSGQLILIGPIALLQAARQGAHVGVIILRRAVVLGGYSTAVRRRHGVVLSSCGGCGLLGCAGAVLRGRHYRSAQQQPGRDRQDGNTCLHESYPPVLKAPCSVPALLVRSGSLLPCCSHRQLWPALEQRLPAISNALATFTEVSASHSQLGRETRVSGVPGPVLCP